MNSDQAEDSSQVIMGTLPVNSIPAKLLFDSGASHCFVSSPFFAKHDFTSAYLDKKLSIISPGKHMTSRLLAPDVSIKMGNHSFLVSPIVLGNSDIDLILGMD